MSRFTVEQLAQMGLVQNQDGSYSKAPVVVKPQKSQQQSVPTQVPVLSDMRTLRLTLFGEPMPKQSVRQGRTPSGKIIFFQPTKMKARVKEYQKQIKEQLPKDWVPFSEEVHVTKLHFVFAPLKGFSKVKGKMDAIREGKRFYKTTKPDLMDNLKKLPFDAMSGIVYEDDGLVCTETDVAKYYGIGGCIIIEMKGR